LLPDIISSSPDGLADWTHDVSEIETPLHIKYVKNEQRGKQSERKKIAKKDVLLPFFINVKNVPSQIIIMEK
jgi:hypothetical protein